LAVSHIDLITEALRKQRKSVDEELESTSARTAENASILAKIEELRARSEATSRRFGISGARPEEESDE
jgi:hypothetical protein